MLANIRTFAKSPAAAVLIVLLIASFAVFGIRDVFKGKAASDAVITAGSRTVSPAEFKREFDNYKTRVEQQVGQPIPMEAVAVNGLDRRALEGMATREAFGAWLQKIGLRPSDKLISSELGKIPAFFDQVTGKFDKKSYETKLGENGLTPERFEGGLRDEISQQQLGNGLAAGMRAPRAYTALAAIYGLESRDVSYFAVEPTSVPQPPAPTDAQLNAFIKANAANLTRPEMRVLTVVRFSAAQVGANIPVDPAELKKRYDFRKDTLSSVETRTVIQIPVKSQAMAQQVGQALASGKDPAAIAKAAGVEAITYDNKPQTAIADRKVGQAAFALKVGQVAPVQGDLGPAIVKVVSSTPGHPVTLEEVKPALEAEIRKDAAQQKAYDLSDAYDKARQAGATMADAAQKVGVTPVTIGPLSNQGRDDKNQPVPGLTQKLVETAFSQPAGGDSEVEDEGNGEYFVVHIDKVIAPSLVPLEEIRPQVTQAVVRAELIKSLQARAEQLAARVTKGETLEAVAASTGQSVVQVPNLDRQSAGQNTTVSQELLGKAFNAKPGEVFTAPNTHFGLVVGKVGAIRAGDGPTQARMAEDMRPQMSMAIFREMAEMAQVATRRAVKVTVNPAQARAALGLPPLETGKDAKKPGLAK